MLALAQRYKSKDIKYIEHPRIGKIEIDIAWQWRGLPRCHQDVKLQRMCRIDIDIDIYLDRYRYARWDYCYKNPRACKCACTCLNVPVCVCTCTHYSSDDHLGLIPRCIQKMEAYVEIRIRIRIHAPLRHALHQTAY